MGTDAMQRAHTMNIKEFHMLLTHCDMLDETLTEAAMQQIFDGIQQSATDEDGGANATNGEDAGIDDDDELSLSEFLDGLVAIAAYKFPDPFIPFHNRVNSFILKLFASVRRHWSRKRISPQVDAMLNALQKKIALTSTLPADDRLLHTWPTWCHVCGGSGAALQVHQHWYLC